MTPEALQAVLSALGLRGERRGRDLWLLCPGNCEDKGNPSWHIALDGEKCGAHHCFCCGFGGGPWELVAQVRGVGMREAGQWVRALLGDGVEVSEEVPELKVAPPRVRRRSGMALPAGVEVPSEGGSAWFQPALDYLLRRGVAEWQLERWHVGYAIRGVLAHRVVVPVYTGGRLLSYVARSYLPATRMRRYDVATRDTVGAWPGGALLGEEYWGGGEVATLVEGAFKLFALEQAGAPNPTAVLGAENAGPELLRLLAGYRTLLVATDPDAAGEGTYQRLRESLGRWTDVRRVPLVGKPDDLLEAGQLGVLEAAWRAALRRRRGAEVTDCADGGR